MFVSIFLGAVSVCAQSSSCFENEGLENANRITFTVSGAIITGGKFEISSYETPDSPAVFEFAGAASAKTLTIKFTGKTPPDFSKIKKNIWTLGKTLKVQTYGKNYVTNKWGAYSATYEKCEAN